MAVKRSCTGLCGDTSNWTGRSQRHSLRTEDDAHLQVVHNFENSRSESCQNYGKAIFPAGEDASISCSKQSCSVLDDEARRLSHGRKAEAPEGTFTVQFIGRAAAFRHEPQYLGDGTRTVLVEKVLKVRVAK